MGYHRAGFWVVGVDTAPQPHYPFEFVRADALSYVAEHAPRFDAIHASPPCQENVKGMAAVNRARGRALNHASLVAPAREALRATGQPYVIENVVGAALVEPITLCGSSFGLAVRRHRLFECSFPVMAPPCAHHLQSEAKYPTNWRPNGQRRLSKVVQVYGNAAGTHLWPEAMGIDWMTSAELTQAIPPAYTEYVGSFLLAAVNARAAA
jgi:DNA (cytosine-5)-methyltransferase 1